ncbi:MAG: hypothetical protein HY049_08105 [Acidobacteria bacterium]|nr:hypothetical protein [Acidobacteriota bacterium]
MSAIGAAVRPQSAVTGPILVIAALPEEIAPLRKALVTARRLRLGGCDAALGRLDGIPAVIASTGDGAARAARGLRAILDAIPISRLLVVGLAGGLTPSLAAGRLVVAREVNESGGAVPAPDAAWMARAVRDAGATPATLVSVPEILVTPSSKARALAALPGRDAAAVDLESAAFARGAAEAGIPYLILRSISDAAGEALPLDFNALRDRDGGVDRTRVALAALRRPSLIAPLWALRGRMKSGAADLARAARAVLAGGAR